MIELNFDRIVFRRHFLKWDYCDPERREGSEHLSAFFLAEALDIFYLARRRPVVCSAA